jgi:hypothetical protein
MNPLLPGIYTDVHLLSTSFVKVIFEYTDSQTVTPAAAGRKAGLVHGPIKLRETADRRRRQSCAHMMRLWRKHGSRVRQTNDNHETHENGKMDKKITDKKILLSIIFVSAVRCGRSPHILRRRRRAVAQRQVIAQRLAVTVEPCARLSLLSSQPPGRARLRGDPCNDIRPGTDAGDGITDPSYAQPRSRGLWSFGFSRSGWAQARRNVEPREPAAGLFGRRCPRIVPNVAGTRRVPSLCCCLGCFVCHQL